MMGKRKCRRSQRSSIERLECRQLLAVTPLITEFLADNNTILADEDKQFSDWIEIYNPDTAEFNLDGLFLTDDARDLAKWRFPAVSLPPGGYIVVFASEKDRAIAGKPLHTNFKLDADGDYLALVAADGQTVLSEYAPEYPQQLPDISYGITVDQELTTLIGPAAQMKILIPTSDALGLNWTSRTFDDTSWTGGKTGIGFEADPPPPAVPGFTVKMIDTPAGDITDIGVARNILNGSIPGGSIITTRDMSVINLGNAGVFGGDLPLPNGFGGSAVDQNAPEREQYALRITANVFIPAGQWTINVNSDDGFLLKIPGISFITRTNENFAGAPQNPSPPDTLVFGAPRGPGNTFATFSVPDPGLSTSLTLDFYERGGGDTVELMISNSFRTSVSASTFSLLADGVMGWTVSTAPSDPPPTFKPLINTDLQSTMFTRNSSAYIRIPFLIDDPADFDILRLRMRYDDGFVAWLNGMEVLRRNPPASGVIDWQSAAGQEHPDIQALDYEDFNLPMDAVVAGQNVLAIQGLNQALDDTDFLIDPQLLGVRTLSMGQRYMRTPTPGASNVTSDLVDVVADTKFSRERGYYDSPIDVSIWTDTPGAQIRYTLDGSAPTATTGSIYTAPIHISTTTILRAAAFKPGYLSSNVDTQTYLFLGDVIHQPNNPPGFPAIGTSGVHWDYEMDPNVVNNAAYSSTIVNDLKSIPSISLVGNVADIFGPQGIYTNPGGTGMAWERPASAEMINTDGSTAFQIDAGLRIYGGVNRSTSFPKHTFRLIFRGQYGAGKLNYPLFDGEMFGDGATDSFDTLILRGEFNNSWPFWVASERQRAQYIHDAFSSMTQLAMGQPAIHQRFVNLYVNGLYWGLYAITERPSAPFAASYLGGSKEDYDALNSSEPIDGDKTAWSTMQSIAAGGVATPDRYELIKQYLDVDNLIDYMILNMYGGNQDWDDHNWYAARKREPGATFKFFSWDAERTLEDPMADRTEVGQADKPSFLHRQLRQNPEYRLLFADHVQKHFFNNGVLTPQAARDRYMALAAEIDRAIVGESARWGNFQRTPAYTRDAEWITEQNRLLTVYFPQRTNNVLNQFKADGLYPSIAAPVPNQFGGVVSSGFKLTFSTPPSGTIWYTTDGSDPRIPGGAVSSSAIAYAPGAQIPIPGTVRIKARTLSGTTWSAIIDITFTYDLSNLRISEIHYHPDQAGSVASGPLSVAMDQRTNDPTTDYGLQTTDYLPDDFEFIELYNSGSTPLDLTGVRFTAGIDFTFSPGFSLAAGQRTVIVRNLEAFQSRYGNTMSITGVYTGPLDNGGERLTLRDATGQILEDFSYDDAWYPQTDGQGYSLVRSSFILPPSSFSSWRPSWQTGGNPGADDPTPAGIEAGAVVVNEVLTHTDAPAGDWIELYNTTAAPIDISGWFLSDSNDDLAKYQIQPGTILPAHGYRVFTFVDHFGVPGNPGVKTPFALSERGDQVYLTAGTNIPAPNSLAGYRESVDFAAAEKELTFGRFIKSTGASDFVAMNAPTPGAANGLPAIGPIILSEIMYAPSGLGDEYIELHNISDVPVPLFDPLHPENTWRFTDGVTFDFPTGAEISAHGYALVVGIDPATFRSKYNIHPAVPIFGPYTGVLADNGEKLELSRPGDVEADGLVPWIVADRVHYETGAPWPAQARYGGASLTRKLDTAYANDVANWDFETGGSAGRANHDTTRPTMRFEPISSPRGSAVNSITLHFDEIVQLKPGLLSLRRDGIPLTINPGDLSAPDGKNWVLSNVASLTADPGTYTVTLNAGGATDLAGNALAGSAELAFTVLPSIHLSATAAKDLIYIAGDEQAIRIWINHDPTMESPDAQYPPSDIYSLSFDSTAAEDLFTIYAAADVHFPVGGIHIPSGAITLIPNTPPPDLTITPDRILVGDQPIYHNGSIIGVGGPFSVSLGTVTIASGARLRLGSGADASISALNISGDGVLDIGQHAVVIKGADIRQITSLVSSARNASPRWSGPGLTSSAAAGDADLGLAIAQIGADVRVQFTWNGDVNLDGRVNADDYFRIDSGFLAHPAQPIYFDGDFNYDGKVNADDYFLIDSAFLNQVRPASSAPAAPLAAVSSSRPSLFSTTTVRKHLRRHRPRHVGTRNPRP